MKSYKIEEFDKTNIILMDYYNNKPYLNKRGIPKLFFE